MTSKNYVHVSPSKLLTKNINWTHCENLICSKFMPLVCVDHWNSFDCIESDTISSEYAISSYSTIYNFNQFQVVYHALLISSQFPRVPANNPILEITSGQRCGAMLLPNPWIFIILFIAHDPIKCLVISDYWLSILFYVSKETIHNVHKLRNDETFIVK